MGGIYFLSGIENPSHLVGKRKRRKGKLESGLGGLEEKEILQGERNVFGKEYPRKGKRKKKILTRSREGGKAQDFSSERRG